MVKTKKGSGTKMIELYTSLFSFFSLAWAKILLKTIKGNNNNFEQNFYVPLCDCVFVLSGIDLLIS